MATHDGFEDNAITSTINAARNFYDRKLDIKEIKAFDDGRLEMLANCISVDVKDGQVCLNLPLGFGGVCLPIPDVFPNGTAAQACLHICSKWGVPRGVRATVSIAGQLIVDKKYGKC